MSAVAIVMMLVAMAVIWGGLVVSVISLLRHGSSDGGAPEIHRDL